MANASNRETSRDALTALLSTALTGGGNPAQAVYGYKPSDLQQQSPVVLVLSNGSGRNNFALGATKYRTFHRFEVISLVREAKGSESWTDQQVEDTLDLIEKTIADVVADNRANTPTWEFLSHEDTGSINEIVPIVIGGVQYQMETISLIAEVHDV